MTSRQRKIFYACLVAVVAVCAALIARTLYLANDAGGALSFVLRQNWRRDALLTCTSLLSLSLGTLLLLVTLVGACLRARYILPILHLAGTLSCVGLWIFLQTGFAALLLPDTGASALLTTFALYCAPLFAALYLRTFVSDIPARILLLDACAAMFALLAGVCFQGFGVLYVKTLMDAGSIMLLLHATCWCSCLYLYVRRNRDKTAFHILLSALPACVGIVAECLLRLFHIKAGRLGFPIGYLFFMVMQTVLILQWLSENAEKSARLEHELYQNRVTMMLSQIQPHFLYNALTAIKQLCATDPARAEEAVGDFAGFLRTNLDSLSKTALIPLTREIVHAEQYFKLEQMRFGERVKLCCELKYTGFSLPTLTVQPLVENAVRYGITKRPEGGTVTIYSDETDESFVVRVSDDGIGFDQSAALSTEREHIGISNVRSRLAALCDGTLTVESTVGQGTVVTIEIPKKEADAE